jgi:hypothetical protein
VADRGRHQGRAGADATLVTALAVGATVEQAAERAGVSARTVHRRLGDADFTRRVDEARVDLVTRAVARVSASATAAADTLRELLGATTPPAVRLGAARSLLELGMKLREHEDLVERVAALEGQLTQEGETKRWSG